MLRMVKNLQREYKKRRRLHRRLRFQSRMLSGMNRLAFYVLVLLVCAGAFAFSFPQYEALEEQKVILAKAYEEQRLASSVKDQAARENRALQEDASYMELVARDTLDYFKPGEVIFEVNRAERFEPDNN